MSISRDVVQRGFMLGLKKDHTKPYLLWLVMLFYYLVVRILSTIPNCMNNDLIISNCNQKLTMYSFR